MRVAELILETLHQHGVRHIFGVPGETVSDFTYALNNRTDMQHILVRHGEAAAFAASAQAKLSGKLSCCMGAAGSGAVQLLNGLYDAKLDRAPVFVVTGQVATDLIGTGYDQEINTEGLFSDVTGYSKTVMDEAQLPSILREAITTVLSERNPVHVSVPTDIAGRQIPSGLEKTTFPVKSSIICPPEAELSFAARAINHSEKPVILAGIGAAEAKDLLLEVSRLIKAPIVRTLRAKDWIDDDHLECIGGVGLFGGETASKAVSDCDLLILVGTDFPHVEIFPSLAKTIQIDRDILQLGKRAEVDFPLHGDAQITLSTLLPMLQKRSVRAFDQLTLDRNKQEQLQRQEDKILDSFPLKPRTVLTTVSSQSPDDAIFLCDTGTVLAWSARFLQVRDRQRFSFSASLGSMGFALSAALGAQLSFPGQSVIALCGDGSFGMSMADFVTAVRNKLPIKVIILENNKLGSTALKQEVKGFPQHEVELLNPDFVAFAKACGGEGFRVNDHKELRLVLNEAFSSPRPTVVSVPVDPSTQFLPPEVSAEQVYNFGLAKIREAIAPVSRIFLENEKENGQDLPEKPDRTER